MSATTPNVGVRVFSDLRQTVASIDARLTRIAMVLPAPNADNSIEMDKPISISTDDAETIALLGAGEAKNTLDQIASEGIITDVLYVRVPDDADLETQIGHIVGSPTAKTGIWALPDAKDEVGYDPSLIISPGYTSQRLGGVANPVAVAMDGVCTRIIDCMGVVDTPETSREAAAEYAADFATSLNMIAMYPAAKVFLDGALVTRPLSPHVAAAIIRRDAEVGNPYKAAWNRSLTGILGASQKVSYRDGHTDHDANFLNFAGVGTVIENKLLWAPFNTATDPTTVGYRSIKRIRTRRSIEKAIPRALRLYNSEDLGPHLVTLIAQSLAEACQERQALTAIIDYEILWPRSLNPNTLMRDGGLRLKLRFEETPDLTDLGIYSEPQPEAFDVLAGEVGRAIDQLGDPRIRAVI